MVITQENNDIKKWQFASVGELGQVTKKMKMMRKTFKSTILGFKLNEEMADKEEKKPTFSLLHYQNTKGRKIETEKRKKNPRTKNRHEKLQYIYNTADFTCCFRNCHKIHFLLNQYREPCHTLSLETSLKHKQLRLLQLTIQKYSMY